MVAEKRSSYEEILQRMIEENKKKLEELNLSLLTKSLWETASPKPSPRIWIAHNQVVFSGKQNSRTETAIRAWVHFQELQADGVSI
ncbi:hypothetical protein QJS10_CPB04g01585 [Acorus calamus]|uniref:Uncharacterized protein n=1 Tax=Acorus calamus TaxID=4465 RepID=A0AAV9EYR8_ACOCL|nr:hypothetical protein QJS10_CPB04g01585 [Acorus calamus]